MSDYNVGEAEQDDSIVDWVRNPDNTDEMSLDRGLRRTDEQIVDHTVVARVASLLQDEEPDHSTVRFLIAQADLPTRAESMAMVRLLDVNLARSIEAARTPSTVLDTSPGPGAASSVQEASTTSYPSEASLPILSGTLAGEWSDDRLGEKISWNGEDHWVIGGPDPIVVRRHDGKDSVLQI